MVAQVDLAALRIRDSILTSAETEGLTYQAYWLSTTLALGAFLKVSLLPLLLLPGSAVQLERHGSEHPGPCDRWHSMDNEQVRSIGKRDCGNLFKLGDDMIQFGGLHALLAASVADMLPVNVGLLLSDEAKRLARTAAAKRTSSGIPGYDDVSSPSAKSFEGLMSSPWKVSPHSPSLNRPQDDRCHSGIPNCHVECSPPGCSPGQAPQGPVRVTGWKW
jgi:hypothetical protein